MSVDRGLVVTGLALLGLSAGCTPTDDADRRTPEPTGSATIRPDGVEERMVDIGGRSLLLVCRGDDIAGEPTVVIEAGPGGTSADSEAVQEEIGEFARVCAYDRAGLGGSDPPPGERTARDLADDLAALLDHSGLKQRYLLVAPSVGAWPVTLYVHRSPEKVAALVLADPRGPGVTARQEAALPPVRPGEPTVISAVRELGGDLA